MTIKEKMKFVLDNQSPKTLKEAKEIIQYQWDVINYLLDQKKETFDMYKALEVTHQKLKEAVYEDMLGNHKPDNLSN